MSRYKEIIERINYGLFLVVVGLLPFPQIALRFASILWIATWILEGRWLKKPHSPFAFRHSPFAIPFILFGIWYGWKILSGLWATDYTAWAWQIERYLSFGLMVPIGLWGVNSRYSWRTVGKVLAISCAVAIPLYTILMTLFYHHPEWVQTLGLEAEWDYHAHRSWYICVSENISVFKHRLFLCSIEMMGMVMALQVWRDKKWLCALLLPVMACAIPLTGSRQSILTLALLIAIGILYLIPRTYRWRYGVGILLIGLLIGGSVLRLHPRMQYFDYQDLFELRDVNQEHEIRLNIWGTALQHPEDYIAYGLGAGQSTNYLVERYRQMGFENYVFKHYHPHNQYLEELMEIGIGGMLFFILIWLSIPLCAKNKGRLTAICFTTLFVLNMCTDCMFGMFCGIALWAVGMLLIFLQSDAEGEQQSARNT